MTSNHVTEGENWHHISELHLTKGETGLGFCIRGGSDNPHLHGDPGIFVTKIRDSGSAARDGRLQEGDKILEIDGISVSEVTHNEAVQLFLNSSDSVTLKVHSGAEKEILERMLESLPNEDTKVPYQIRSRKHTIVWSALGLGVAGAALVGFCWWRMKNK